MKTQILTERICPAQKLWGYAFETDEPLYFVFR